MDGNDRRIEIIQPFSDAIELTKQILFRPFDFKKWCVIGFAAFLAQLGKGGFNFQIPNSKGSTSHYDFSWGHLEPWVIALLVALFLIVLTVVFVFWWIRCRGAFILIDCIVHNRGAIAKPWREYKVEGNSLFGFQLVVAILLMITIAMGAVPIVWIWIRTQQPGGFSSQGLTALLVIAPVLLLLIICWALLVQLIIPVMYAQRCRAVHAAKEIMALVKTYPGEFVLWCLFGFLIGIGVILAVFVLMCATCCLVLLPYVGTVIMLPIIVCMTGYTLLFLRQFGERYDVWAGGNTPPATPAVPEGSPA